ncbi:Protein of unknown function [Weissella confusa LBAE C39-2]|nr:Protein of unknown function [Weissella confusa LBAE C39-2]
MMPIIAYILVGPTLP